jgi:hypothetical protein
MLKLDTHKRDYIYIYIIFSLSPPVFKAHKITELAARSGISNREKNKN